MHTHVAHIQQGGAPERSGWLCCVGGHSSLGEAGNLEGLFHLPLSRFCFRLGPDSGLEGETHTPLSSGAWEPDFLLDVSLLSVLAVQGRVRAFPNVASASVRTDSGG